MGHFFFFFFRTEFMDKIGNWLQKVTASKKQDVPAHSSVDTSPPEKPQHSSPPHRVSSPQSSPENAFPRPSSKPNFSQHSHQRNQQRPHHQRKEGHANHAHFSHEHKMRVIPIGGLNEVGKNCMCVEYKNDIILIDIGLQFPEENMPGIDYVIPDVSYIERKKQNLRGVLITHGHLDHIGALPHILPKLNFPTLYATKLTAGLIEKRLEEFDMNKRVRIVVIDPEKADTVTLGSIKARYFRVNHSIPDGCGIYLKTPAGTMVHTGDFKFDFSPADGLKCEFSKIADIGREGVDVIFADSTNARKPDFCKSERVIGETLDGIVRDAKGRLIIASFSSLVGRIQQIVNSAHKYGRKVFIEGRSMVNNIEIAIKLGYIKIPTGIFRKMGPQVNDLPPHEVLIIMTGSQGEPMSALSRIARDEHRFVKIDFQDTVVLSASPIPGNERPTYNVIDSLHRKGAQVITNDSMDVHISGHAHQGDLKLMHSLVMPKYIVPIHGEYFMRLAHRDMVIRDLGYEEKNAIMLENGSVLEISNGMVHKSKEKIVTDPVFVDGLGVGDVGTQILRERQAMAAGGIVVVLIDLHSVSKSIIRDPVIISRGFLENQHIEKNAVLEVKVSLEGVLKTVGNEANEKIFSEAVVRHLQGFFLRKIDREPMILPIVRFV